jgi:hypothetical protein
MKKKLLVLFITLALLAFPLTSTIVKAVDPGSNITNQDFDELNPLKISDPATTLTTPGGIISQVLEFAFPIAGFILFIMIVWGGFEMLMGATSKKTDAGRQRVTAAVIGFFLLFISFWIIQIVDQALLGGNLSVFSTQAPAQTQQTTPSAAQQNIDSSMNSNFFNN